MPTITTTAAAAPTTCFSFPPFILKYTPFPFPFSFIALSLSLSLYTSSSSSSLCIHLSPATTQANCIAMGSESVTVEGFAFPTVVSPFGSSKSLTLFGTGIIDQEIHFLQIKHTASAVYVDPEIVSYLQAWKGKKTSDLLEEESGFFQSFCEAPVEKFMKVVIIKEVKGSQYMGLLQSPVRDRLAALDKYEEDEEEALEKLLAFFQTKSWFTQGTSIFFHFSSPSKLQVSVSEDGNLPAAAEYVVENANVVYGILEYLAGERCQSPSLLKSMAEGFSTLA